MNFYILVLILIAVVALILFLRVRSEAKKHKASVGEELAGMCSFVLEQTVQKNGNKRKILKLFEEKGQLSNAEIRGALGVSSRTVVRYLDELEQEGIVEQVGATGQSVAYRLRS